MGGAGDGAGCRTVLPPSSSTGVLVVQLVADGGAVQGCSDADEPSDEGHHVTTGGHLQRLHQGLLVQPVLAQEVHGGALCHVDFPPVVAGHLMDLSLQPSEQGSEVFRMLLEEGSPDLGWEVVLSWDEHRLCRPLLVLQAVT